MVETQIIMGHLKGSERSAIWRGGTAATVLRNSEVDLDESRSKKTTVYNNSSIWMLLLLRYDSGF